MHDDHAPAGYLGFESKKVCGWLAKVDIMATSAEELVR